MNTHANLTNEEQTEALSVRKNRIGSELLLARLCRCHPDEARLALKGFKPSAKDDDLPPITRIVVSKIIIAAPPPPPPPANVIPLVCEAEPAPNRHPSIHQVIEHVAAFYEISTDDLLSECRQTFIVKPRQVAMYLCRELTPFSFPKIGRMFGGRDHTTIIHSWCKIAAGVGTLRGKYVHRTTGVKFADCIEQNDRLKDEIEVIKLRVRQALLNSNPGTEHATAQPAAH